MVASQTSQQSTIFIAIEAPKVWKAVIGNQSILTSMEYTYPTTTSQCQRQGFREWVAGLQKEMDSNGFIGLWMKDEVYHWRMSKVIYLEICLNYLYTDGFINTTIYP